MPRLLGYRERVQINIYDAFSLDRFRPDGKTEIFHGENIGRAEFTNLVVAKHIDGTVIVANWYARCPLDPSAAFNEWAHATVLWIRVGSRPITSLPLSDLLQRKQGDYAINLDEGYADRVTEKMYDGYIAEMMRTGCETPIGAASWGGMCKAFPGQRSAWYEAFRIARAEMQPAREVVIIPTRQWFDLQITTSLPALKALTDRGCPSDRPIVWVHLEGLSTRDGC